MWQQLEQAFNRALSLSFQRKRIFFIFPILLVCGIVVVLSHALWVESNPWIRTGFAFIPVFLCVAIFLAAGVPLIQLHHDDAMRKPISVSKTLRRSWRLMGAISSLIVPILTADIVLWFILGVFYLLKNIPATGEVVGIILSFGPFLLIAGSLLLCGVALAFLFFLTPIVALKGSMSWELAEGVLKRIAAFPFMHAVLILFGLLPLVIVVFFLILSAKLTGMTYLTPETIWAIGLQWFCIMIPFAALVSPALVFFFNFAAESFDIMQRKLK